MPGKIRIIEIPQIEKVETLAKWVNHFRYKTHNLRKFPARCIKIDFKRMKFIRPYHIAPLACVIYEYLEHDFKIKLTNLSDEQHEYLNSLNFMKYCDGESEKSYSIHQNFTAMPIWRIEQNAVSSYPDTAQKFFENNSLTGFDLFPLSNALGELLNNVIDHSESKIPGFTFSQLNRTHNQLILSVCDFGIGFPKKINNYLTTAGKANLSEIDAVIKAVESKFSTKSFPHNRGFGWDTLLSSIKAIKSRLVLVTGSVIYVILPNGKKHVGLLQNSFPGALIAITLKVNQLSPKDEIYSEENHLL
jgi:hypothetical protein